MSIDDALAYIHGFQRFGSKPGLRRIAKLLDLLGRPQDGLRCVHVAGSSGKGSTCAMLASILQAAGNNVGLFVSPGIESFSERIQINGIPIAEAALAALVSEIKPVIEGMAESPTEFEVVTALGFLHFAREKTDVAVIEVGLGGRFDSTNVIEKPLCSVITPISLDHTEILGDTVAQIAGEKAGIIKPGCPVVTCFDQDAAALAVFGRVCGELGCTLTVARECSGLYVGLDKTSFRMPDGDRYEIPLHGKHQAQNAVTALTAARLLGVPEETCRAGLAAVKLNGRLEIVRESPLCLIDGAHNAAKISALAEALDDLLPGRRIVSVMGMSADKQADVCVPMIARASAVFIAFDGFQGRGRVADAQMLAALASPHCGEVYTAHSMKEAASLGLEKAGEDGVLLFCGSIYFIGDAKQTVKHMDAHFHTNKM
ncbi:MAG: bifunctional folylpolyglutamate synthase/dihydrofolate synthase [Oscillospiraceae bacterium]|jgi:dihydrofolate synthase/folylpolyglutamate synthase|nr:bifunctional folylpolyglutamate synthase/dihydrofolate synthase [Oscillospiraceae bacterium]